MMYQQENDLLTNFEDKLVRASTGKRFVNYLIDLFVYFIIVFAITLLISLVNPDILAAMNSNAFDPAEFLLNTSIYVGYMFLSEAFFNGKSLGKLVTGTRAVHLDGSKINGTIALKRALARAIPFSGFSALGTPCNPWWDKWTDTIVMDEKLSAQATEQNF